MEKRNETGPERKRDSYKEKREIEREREREREREKEKERKFERKKERRKERKKESLKQRESLVFCGGNWTVICPACRSNFEVIGR